MHNYERYVHADEVRKSIQVLCKLQASQVFEIRIISDKAGLMSGYFRDADSVFKAMEKVDLNQANVYITLQLLKEELFGRKQSNKFLKVKQATQDNEVRGYTWLFIDLDPERSSGISSSDDELAAAEEMANNVKEFMKEIGFHDPILAKSGNGYHLLYRILLEKTNENQMIIKDCLEALNYIFSDEKVKVDTSNFNPSRICKLHGTLAQKGSDIPERPHRFSQMLEIPEPIERNEKDILQILAGMKPAEPEPPKSSYVPHDTFDLETWLRDHGIHYKKEPWIGHNATKYVLDKCAFDSGHVGKDAAIIQSASGALSYKCFHNSCQQRTWREFRLLYEPDAYDKEDALDDKITESWKQHNRLKNNVTYEIKDDQHPDPKEPMFLTMKQILEKNEPEGEYLPTGITFIDKNMQGLQKTAVSVLTGLRGAAKSTLLSQIMLNVINNDHRVICYSGELSSNNFARWLFLQAAGKDHVIKSTTFENFFTVPEDIKDKIADWMEGKFWLYNNNYGNRFAQIANTLQAKIKEVQADFVVLDNLMALDLTGVQKKDDKYDMQTDFVWKLKDIAKVCNVHVLFVAHPRKANGFLRLDDISGSGNIANIVDNAFIIHRKNADFMKKTAEEFKWPANHKAYAGTNVIEICKDRENGIQDEFVPLWYEQSTKRLLNSEGEYVDYGWDTECPYDLETRL